VRASYDYLSSEKEENIDINGVSALRLTGVTTDHPLGVTVVNTFIKIKDKMFVFNYGGKDIPQSEKENAEKIINSFTAKIP
jgi:hypothetical protein